jgi:hypothetical protein
MLVSTTDVYADWMDSSSGEIYPSLGYLPDTGLHHIVMCGTGTALRIYFDGVYDSQSTFPGGSLTTTTTRFGNSPSRTAGFLGDIATVRIYSTNIGDSGVSDNYNAGVLAYGGTLDAAASDRSFFIARGIGIG